MLQLFESIHLPQSANKILVKGAPVYIGLNPSFKARASVLYELHYLTMA